MTNLPSFSSWFSVSVSRTFTVPVTTQLGYQLADKACLEFNSGQLIMVLGGIQSGKTRILTSVWENLEKENFTGCFIDGHFSLSNIDLYAAGQNSRATVVARPTHLQEAIHMAEHLIVRQNFKAIFADGIFELPLQTESFKSRSITLSKRIELVESCCRQLLRLAQKNNAVVFVSCCEWTDESALAPVIANYADRSYHVVAC